ncbi:hypothetical protein [Paraburkholderia fungorum]|uniref:Ribosomal protein L19E n=1 Tax=Paraburkholderia fungorum TaxID=134537 RepID=A0AAW3V0B4_9BURK|nr:hypothetical protein [Paraburkholderia fungorum]MBB4517295.1 ribosomal protein L19E [Paraburkholderia fungorum]MBB6204364.1 ribosomal protein L19E [Paraburkholderia fungorum]
MNILQQVLIRDIEARGGRVFTFDVGTSSLPILQQHAQRKLERMRRYGSRKVKVTIRRSGAMTPIQALAEVRIALRQHRRITGAQ